MVPILDEFQNKINSDEDDALSDEAILNVLRRNDDRVLKTSEIAEELPITPQWTSQRLNQLENKGRVHSKSAGQGRVWWLGEAESPYPVAEGIGDLMWYSSLANQTSRTVTITALGMFVVSGVGLILIFLLGMISSLEMMPFSTNDVAVVAILAAIVAGLLIIVGGLLKLVSIAIQNQFARK